MKRRILALVCALVILVGSVPARAITEADIYFTSVNDHLLPLTADTMPTWVGNKIYVPASVFDSNSTNTKLGISCKQDSTGNTVTLYTPNQALVFDLAKGIACDQNTQEQFSYRAMNRNGKIYVPVDGVCDFFGLSDTYAYTRYGYLVRIRNENSYLDDDRFIDAAGTELKNRSKAFLQSQNTVVPDPPDVPAPPPVVDDPVISQPPEQDQSKAQLYLAFRCTTGDGLESILNTLDRHGVRALFLFSSELLVLRDDLVRRVVGSGHSIGLLSEEENAVRDLTAGNRLLAHIAHTAATTALVPAAQRAGLEAEGWICWSETFSALPRSGERAAAYAQRIINSIGSRRRTVYLTMDDSSTMANVINTTLSQFEQEKYTILAPLETRL